MSPNPTLCNYITKGYQNPNPSPKSNPRPDSNPKLTTPSPPVRLNSTYGINRHFFWGWIWRHFFLVGFGDIWIGKSNVSELICIEQYII